MPLPRETPGKLSLIVGSNFGWVSAVDSEGRTIWIADAPRDGRRFVVRANEIMTAFLELESAIRACGNSA